MPELSARSLQNSARSRGSSRGTSRSSSHSTTRSTTSTLPNATLPLLREKSRLEAARLKKEKLILLEQMVHFTEAAEHRIAKRVQKAQKQRSSFGHSTAAPDPYLERSRLLKDLKVVKDFARRKIPNPKHFKKLQHLYPGADLSGTARTTSRSTPGQVKKQARNKRSPAITSRSSALTARTAASDLSARIRKNSGADAEESLTARSGCSTARSARMLAKVFSIPSTRLCARCFRFRGLAINIILLFAVGSMMTTRSTLTDYAVTVNLSKELANLDGMSSSQLMDARLKMQKMYDQLVAKERKYKDLYSARSTARSDVTYVQTPLKIANLLTMLSTFRCCCWKLFR